MIKFIQTQEQRIDELEKIIKDNQRIDGLERIVKENQRIDILERIVKENQSETQAEIERLKKQIETSKPKQSSSSSPALNEELTARIVALGENLDYYSKKIDSLTGKLEQTNKDVADVEKKCDKKIKQIQIPDLSSLDFVSTEEINDLIGQIDEKINQFKEQSDTNLKAMAKSLDESHNKAIQAIEKKIKDSSDAVSKNPKASDNLESIEKELSELTNYVAQIESQLESTISQPEVQSMIDKTIKENKRNISEEVDEKLIEVANQLKKELKPQEKKGDGKDTELLKEKLDSLENQIIGLPDFSDDIQDLNARIEILEGKAENDEDAGISADILFRFKNIEEHVETKFESTDNSITELSSTLDNTISKIEEEKLEVDSRLDLIEKQLKNSPPSAPKQDKGGVSDEEIKQITNSLETKLNALKQDTKQQVDKLSSKLAEQASETENTLNDIREQINNIEEDSTNNINSVIEMIQKQESECISSSNNFSSAIDQIQNQIDDKHSELDSENSKLIDSFKKLESKVNSQIEDAKQPNASTSSPVDEGKISQLEDKLKSFKDEITKTLAELKTDLEKEKGFGRDRILNCIQDSNAAKDELKALIKASIDKLEASENNKLKALEDEINMLKGSIKNNGPIAEKQAKEYSDLANKISELENKDKNEELKSLVEAIVKNKLAETIEKPLKFDNQKSKHSDNSSSSAHDSKEENKIAPKIAKPVKSVIDDKKTKAKQPNLLYDNYEDDFEDAEDIDEVDESGEIDLKQTKVKALKELKEMEVFQIQSPFQDHRTPEATMNDWIKRINNARQLKDIILIAQEIEEETGYDIGKAVFNNEVNQEDDIDLKQAFDRYNFDFENDDFGETQKFQDKNKKTQQIYDDFNDGEDDYDDYDDDFA